MQHQDAFYILVFIDSGETALNVNEEYNCTTLKGVYTWQKTNSVK